MKIDSYNIGMESERLYKSYSTSRRYVSRDGSNSSTGSPLSSFEDILGNNRNPAEDPGEEKSKKTDTAEVTQRALRDLSSRAPINIRSVSRSASPSDQFQKLHELMIRRILDMLFGKRSITSDSDEAAASGSPFYETYVESQYVETSHYEQESVSYDAKGVVKTSDGREININLSIGMSREFSSYYTECTKQEMIRFCDPLVINFDDVPASVSDMKFMFDLDADGVGEEISYLNSASGYLALDKNEDGIINDGSELFGTRSGDGFKDLTAYDSDKNGWIDENDEIFDKLKIWVSDSNGNSTLYSLKDKNVGAIYLGSADTEFSLNSKLDNTINGVVRKTGIFLYENGQAGSVQHIDLVS